MNLSEAMRLGAMATGQAFNDYYDDKGNACAIGAACIAAGVTRFGIQLYEAQFEHIFEQPCPECGLRPDKPGAFRAGFINTVLHLNDDHRLTREQIADWVESIERAHEAARSPVGQLVTA